MYTVVERGRDGVGALIQSEGSSGQQKEETQMRASVRYELGSWATKGMSKL